MPRITVLPGDGIGPEVAGEAVRVLIAVGERFGFEPTLTYALVGGAALDEFDTPLPEPTFEACKAADAVLLGAIGGPRWDHETGDRRCEAALLGLRKRLGVFANLRPVLVPAGLSGQSPVRADRVDGTDILIVRELTGGIYFGAPRKLSAATASNTMVYHASEIRRIARVAFAWAEKRRGRVTSVDKANVLEVSQLWRRVVTQVHREEFAHLALDHLYVDNAAMQLVLRPGRFDVILTGNLFGDILSDLAATLPGSLGLLPSASLGGQIGLFEPVHGSAPDIAGLGIANPAGIMLSAAMMLDALDLSDAAHAVRSGVLAALGLGVRTRDLGGTASTGNFANAVISHIRASALAAA
ncbi:MAG: 3-isopropylmalate dehydrogenase [Bacteroidota bacterium]|nr:3-isopropylmalate dehydrogenase [Bacteroidota bacterium]